MRHPPPQPPADVPVPDDVDDILLWRLAADVLRAHQPHPTRPRRCTSLLCAQEAFPCRAWQWASRAQHAARAGTRGAATHNRVTARGRARVPAAVADVDHRRWETPADRRAAAAAVAVAAGELPRRTPGAALDPS